MPPRRPKRPPSVAELLIDFAKIHVMKVLGMSVRKPTRLRAAVSDLDALWHRNEGARGGRGERGERGARGERDWARGERVGLVNLWAG